MLRSILVVVLLLLDRERVARLARRREELDAVLAAARRREKVRDAVEPEAERRRLLSPRDLRAECAGERLHRRLERVEPGAHPLVVGEQLDMLRQFGCDQVQGYLISRPIPAADFERALAEGILIPGLPVGSGL